MPRAIRNSKWLSRPTFPFMGVQGASRQLRITNGSQLSGPQDKIVCTFLFQMECFARGSFILNRHAPDERAIIQPMKVEVIKGSQGRFYTKVAQDNDPTRVDLIIHEMVTKAFGYHDAKKTYHPPDPFWCMVQCFIEQQDRFGWIKSWAASTNGIDGNYLRQVVQSRKLKLGDGPFYDEAYYAELEKTAEAKRIRDAALATVHMPGDRRGPKRRPNGVKTTHITRTLRASFAFAGKSPYQYAKWRAQEIEREVLADQQDSSYATTAHPILRSHL